MKRMFFLLLVICLFTFKNYAQEIASSASNDLVFSGFSKTSLLTDPNLNAVVSEAINEKGSSSGAAQNFYIVVRFHKVEAGKRDEYLKTMESVKNMLQMRKDKGEVRSWSFFKRTFPSGTSSEYDYITSTAFDNGAQMEALEKLTTSDMVNGLSHEDASRVENMADVVKIIRREVYVFQTSLPEGKNGKYLRVGGIKVNTGMSKDYEKMIQSTIPVVAEGAKAGKLTNRTSWRRCFPIGSELNDYTVVTEYENMTAALNSVGSDFKDEYMKIYPKTDYEAEVKKFNQMRTQMWSELWERVFSTK